MSARDHAHEVLDAKGGSSAPWPSGGPACAFFSLAGEAWVRVNAGDTTYVVHHGTGRVFGRGIGNSKTTSWKVGALPHPHRAALSPVMRACLERRAHPVPVSLDSPVTAAKPKADEAKPTQEVPVSKMATAPAPFSRPLPPPPPTLTASSREVGRVTVVESEHSVELTHARLVALVAFASGRQIPDGAVVRVVWADRPEEPAMGPGDGVKVAWTTTSEAKA